MARWYILTYRDFAHVYDTLNLIIAASVKLGVSVCSVDSFYLAVASALNTLQYLYPYLYPNHLQFTEDDETETKRIGCPGEKVPWLEFSASRQPETH